MTSLRPTCIVLVAVGGCAAAAPDVIPPYYESTKADGDRRRLWMIDRDRTEVEEPSDLVFAGDTLYAVSDRRSRIYEISRGGKIRDSIDVEGSDLEAITVDPRTGELVIGGEDSDKVWYVDADGERTWSIEIDGANDGNSGIEGLAFDDDAHLFVAKEKDPARIYELDEDGFELARTKIDFAEDLSALAYHEGHLYALSATDRALYRLDRDLTVDTAWRLPIDEPEGLAFDGDTLYVVSDSEQRIYELELD